MKNFWYFPADFDPLPALLSEDGEVTTYRQLSAEADDWRNRFVAAASGKRPVIGFEFDLHSETIAAYIGALRSGFPILISEPRKLFTGSRMRAVWEPELLVSRNEGVLGLTVDQSVPDHIPPHHDLAVLLSTSGSTGDPKLVRLSAQNIDSNACAIVEYLGITSKDRTLTSLPLFYSYGLSVLHSYLAAGASIVVSDASVSSGDFKRIGVDRQLTSLAFVPHQFELAVGAQLDFTAFSTLRYLTQAGGKLSQDLVRDFYRMGKDQGWDLYVMYGQTEAAPRISYVPPSSLPDASDTIGKPVPGGRLWLSDDAGNPVEGVGIPGELVYEGPNVMMGYAIGRLDLAAPSGPSVLRTGDIAERTIDGFYRIVGRMKRFVKIFGLRISLDQVENLITENGLKAEAVAVEDRLVLLGRSDTDLDLLRQIVSNAYGLPPTAIAVDRLEKLPMLPSGKTDHKALKRFAIIALERASAKRAVRLESVADILATATRSVRVGPDDSFVSLGGDSLSYLNAMISLEERLGHVPDGWERMSVSQLDKMVASDGIASGKLNVGIDVLLRLIAICMIVAQHASDYPIFGGAWVLVAVIGFSAARFQLEMIGRGDWLKLGLKMLFPILPLYFVLLFVYHIGREAVPWDYFLLVGNYRIWQEGSLLEVYWFVSLYAQFVLFFVLLSGIRPLGNAFAKRPFRSGWVLFLLLALTTVALTQVYDVSPYHRARGFAEAGLAMASGWLIQSARGPLETILAQASAGLACIVLWNIGIPLPVICVLAAAMFVMSINVQFRLPIRIAKGLIYAASLTLYVYLGHEIIVFALQRSVLPQPIVVFTAIIASFAAAMVCKSLVDALVSQIAARQSYQRLAIASQD